MATAELITEKLVSVTESGCSSPLMPCDPKGSAARPCPDGVPSEPEIEANPAQRWQGFVYDGVRAGRAIRAGLSRRPASSRPLPMEEVALFVKSIDNSQLRRKPDPKGKTAWRQWVGVGCLVFFTLVAGYGPRAWLRHAGYRQAQQEGRYQALFEINRQLKVRESMLTDLRRVAELASARGLTAPPPERFAWQDRTIPPADGAGVLAQVRGASKP
jgi:hypothetical protein